VHSALNAAQADGTIQDVFYVLDQIRQR